MTEKKNAINISIGMISICMIAILLCWRGEGITELIFVLASGVFGSSFATLWIFVYEYNVQKRELLSSIFHDAVAIMDKAAMLPSLAQIGFYDSAVLPYLRDKYYVPPVNADCVANMSEQERCLYKLCRFVDGFIAIDYSEIRNVLNYIEKLDFWTDGFRRKQNRKVGAIIEKISIPMSTVFVSAPAMEDGYLFRYFKQFKTDYVYSAEEVYPFVKMLDEALRGDNDEQTYSFLKLDPNVLNYMHAKLWIFRDAFFSPYVSRRERREAMQAFVGDLPYHRIR